MTLFRAGVIRRRPEKGGPVLQAAFFLGPRAFYSELNALSDEESAAIFMTSVTRVNDLFGEESLARRQRHDARFINICMLVTLSGAAVSDGLADGRVVSGVGGQYNFVAMAHELVFNYGHVTIPRHLRDIVITEYGVADLRGRTDAEVAAALIAIADARFQEGLVAGAKAAGKLPRDWRIPQHALQNTPERLAASLAISAKGLLPMFPLGTDFDADEQRLIPALQWLKRSASTWSGRMRLAAAFAGGAPAEAEARALARMGLAAPQGLKERVLQRILALALRRTR